MTGIIGGYANATESMAVRPPGVLTDHELETLCVPLQHCISVKIGPVDVRILADLEKRGYDQAPVYDASGRFLLGLISTERLRAIQASAGKVSEHDDEVRDE